MSEQQEKFEFNERRKVDARIVRLEQITENLTGAIEKLTNDVSSLAQLMRDSNKTNWGVMATWAGVIIMVAVALGNGYIGKPLDNLAITTKEIRNEVRKHEVTGHPGTINRVNNNSAAIVAVDQKLSELINLKEKYLQLQINQLRKDLDKIKGK